MELNVWMKSTVVSATYDEGKHEWTVNVSREGLPDRTLKPKVKRPIVFLSILLI